MAEHSGVFVLQSDNSLISMQPAQFAREEDFQQLLQRFPALLVGDQIDPENPRRWALVKRELSVSTGEIGSSQWSIDHLFLDQDGIPTLVEIKRQSDSRIRREVVGQMLDYAANCATHWSIGMLVSHFEKTCEAAGEQSEAVIAQLIGNEQPASEFWDQVKRNLDDGRIRLLFVADVVPIELRRIVEFLNRQMDPAEVLAIELRQFMGEGGLKTIVPMVFGHETLKSKGTGVPGQRWDEERFFEKLKQNASTAEIDLARAIFDRMKRSGQGLMFGTGKANGSVWPDFRVDNVRLNPMYLSTDSCIYLPLSSLAGKPALGSLERRREILSRFGTVNGVSFDDAELARWPHIELKKVAADPEGLSKVLSVMNWIEDQISAASNPSSDS